MLPMSVIAGQDDAFGAGYILKEIDPRFLQPSADQFLADAWRSGEKKRTTENGQQAIESHPDFVRLVAFDIGKMFLQIFDHLIG